MSKDVTAASKHKGLLVAISGPSGVGKGSVIERVRSYMPQIHHSISVTTRPQRACETEGVAYHFCSVDAFRDMMARGEILEYDMYLNHYYGTPLPPVLKLIDDGQDVLFDLTVTGSLTLRDKFPEAVLIYLLPPSMSELRRRLERRGTEGKALIDRRLMAASVEIPKADMFEYVIINDDIDKAARSVLSIIEAERHRYMRQQGIEETILAL